MPTFEQYRFGVIVSGIAAVVGVLGATVTLYSQVSTVAESYVSAKLKQDFAPVGTVVSSVLPPDKFAIAIGEIEGDDLKRRKWILADGRDVTGTEYARKTGAKPVPDLRGMFLRGIDPGSSRNPGSIEKSATALPVNKAFVGTTTTGGEHDHKGGAAASGVGDRYNAGGRDYVVVNVTTTAKDGAHSHLVKIDGGGDEETRPVNVAVYYFIKIN